MTAQRHSTLYPAFRARGAGIISERAWGSTVRHYLSPSARRVRDYLKERGGEAEMAPGTDGVAELTHHGMAQPVTVGVDEPIVVLTPFGKAHTGTVIQAWTLRERLTQLAAAGVASGAAYVTITLVGYPGIPAAVGFAVIFAAIVALRAF